MAADTRIRRILLVIAPILLLAGCGEELPPPTGSADGYERVVLAELFTAVWCGNCKYSEEALDCLYDEEGPRRLAVIHWHPSIGGGDPFAFSFSDARVSDYQHLFGEQVRLPLCVFDGVAGIPEGTAATYSLYRHRYELEAALLSVARIALDPVADGNALTVGATVSGFPGGAAIDADLVVAIVEHDAPNPGVTGPDTLSYVGRAARSEAVSVTPGSKVERAISFTLEPSWKREDLYVVAFLQESTPAEGREYREVLQAAMTPVFPEEQPFYAFFAAAPDTNIGVPAGGERAIPFTITNTGTLDDTLTIDLPTGLLQIPASWTVTLKTVGGAEIITPTQSLLPAGGVINGLRIAVAAPVADSGTVGVVVTSTGSPALVDTLTFHLRAGDYGFELSASDLEIIPIVDLKSLTPVALANTGTLGDSVTVSIPLLDLPACGMPHGGGTWEVSLESESGAALGQSAPFGLPAGGETQRVNLAITACTDTDFVIPLIACSHGDPALSDTLHFSVTPRVYNFTLSSEETDTWVVVGAPERLAFEIENRGARDDILEIDLPATLQALPEGWQLDLTFADDLAVPTPHTLLVEAGQIVSEFGVTVGATTAGSGRFGLVVASHGDPRRADTLAFQITADEYGFELRAPAGSSAPLDPGTAVLLPVEVANTGTVNDLLFIDVPAELSEIPAGWQVHLSDPDSVAVSLPQLLAVGAGAADTSLRLYALASTEGEAHIGLVASSSSIPALTDTLIFILTAASSDYTLELTSGPTVIPVAVGSFGEAHFTIENTGSLDDTVSLLAESLEEPHPWGPPTLCRGSACYPPFTPVEVELAV